jgi:hypothetical protein
VHHSQQHVVNSAACALATPCQLAVSRASVPGTPGSWPTTAHPRTRLAGTLRRPSSLLCSPCSVRASPALRPHRPPMAGTARGPAANALARRSIGLSPASRSSTEAGVAHGRLFRPCHRPVALRNRKVARKPSTRAPEQMSRASHQATSPHSKRARPALQPIGLPPANRSGSFTPRAASARRSRRGRRRAGRAGAPSGTSRVP